MGRRTQGCINGGGSFVKSYPRYFIFRLKFTKMENLIFSTVLSKVNSYDEMINQRPLQFVCTVAYFMPTFEIKALVRVLAF